MMFPNYLHIVGILIVIVEVFYMLVYVKNVALVNNSRTTWSTQILMS